MTPLDRPVVDVLTIAKKDRAAGEAWKLDALPVGLAPGALMVKPARTGDLITWPVWGLKRGDRKKCPSIVYRELGLTGP